jgi:hypothetical protein
MRSTVFGAVTLVIAMLGSTLLAAESPTIPPSIDRVWPAGIQRGTTAMAMIEGRNLEGAQALLFGFEGIRGRVLSVTAIPETEMGDALAAPIPKGKKQQAKVELTVAAEVNAGLHGFRVQTPLGTSNVAVIDVGALPEIHKDEAHNSPNEPQKVQLPATLIGALAKSGDVDTYRFDGRADEELVFQLVGPSLGSALQPWLILRDATGKVLVTSSEHLGGADALLTCKLPRDGEYTLAVSDRQLGGSAKHFYRLDAGPLPYISSVFPLGVRTGRTSKLAVAGLNLGHIERVQVKAPGSVDGWSTMALPIKISAGEPVNRPQLAVGNEAEVLESEPNDSPAQAQQIIVPVTINGRIGSDKEAASQAADEDYFRFEARKDQRLTLEVIASRLGSALDSVIEVLDQRGNPLPRASVRCLTQTSITLSDRDSKINNFRLLSTSGLRDNDYILVGDELAQLDYVPDQPDAETYLKSFAGERLGLLGTSPTVHHVDEMVCKAEIHKPGVQVPANGLPVHQVMWRNDDAGPGYGRDSRLDFVAPEDGEYILHLRDVRGLEGPDFAYRLSIREWHPDFKLDFEPANPNVPRGGRVAVQVNADRAEGYQGAIELAITGLPKGIRAAAAEIPAGQDSAQIVLEATENAPSLQAAPFVITGSAIIEGRRVARPADGHSPLDVVAVMPSPDINITAEPERLVIEPGRTATVTLHVNRANGFAGRVQCVIKNLPPGVRVDNLGLNGVLVPAGETIQTFHLRAADWARPVEQPFYIVGQVESSSPTEHASPPIDLNVSGNRLAAAAPSN